MGKKPDRYLPLTTRWQLGSEILPEYPRPSMVRNSWMNLNGIWKYSITEEDRKPSKYDGDIKVPFSPETRLSGVERQLMPNCFLWYERECSITDDIKNKLLKNGHLLLHFGAVDQSCNVYINGECVGNHMGGYFPFTFDITKYVVKDNTVLDEFVLGLKVVDVTDTSYHSVGKQTLTPGGMYYPGTSGIWQSVWMEAVNEVFIESLRWKMVYKESRVNLHLYLNKFNAVSEINADSNHHDTKYKVFIHFIKGEYPDIQTDLQDKISISLPNFQKWSPENPYLYHVKIQIKSKDDEILDQVESYFAMREVKIDTDKNGIRRIFLNGKPYLNIGVLDQGYWPESMYTAPCDEAMISDIKTMKELGFNMIRKHIKLEPERWYYHCDKLGMLVWQDMINGGRKNKGFYVTYLATVFQFLHIKGSDRHPFFLSRQDQEGKKEYVCELSELVGLMENHPSVVCIVPFNEGWGQFSTRKATELIRMLNPNVLIDQASGWYDMRGGDFISIHNYFFKLKLKREAYRALALTEFGGYALREEGHYSHEREYGYKSFATKEELTKGYEELMRDVVLPAVKEGISATVYTQLSDVEEEVNGILTYDRDIIKLDINIVKKYNEECKNAL